MAGIAAHKAGMFRSYFCVAAVAGSVFMRRMIGHEHAVLAALAGSRNIVAALCCAGNVKLAIGRAFMMTEAAAITFMRVVIKSHLKERGGAIVHDYRLAQDKERALPYFRVLRICRRDAEKNK